MKKFLILFSTITLLISTFFATTGFTIDNADADTDNAEFNYLCDVSDELPKDSYIDESEDTIEEITILEKAGEFDTDIYIEDNNRYGEIWWSAILLNGDFIKSINGTIIIKRDWFGPYNPTVFTYTVNFYNYGTLYSFANDVVEFDLGGTYDDSDNFIFQFKNFTAIGVEETYTFQYREVQKELGELDAL